MGEAAGWSGYNVQSAADTKHHHLIVTHEVTNVGSDRSQPVFVFAELFGNTGDGELLDGRSDIVAALLEVDECPFPEQPIILNVHLWRTPSSLLFVENHVSFERLRRRTDLVDTALVYSSGFHGAALRLRKPQGASIYYSRGCPDDAIGAFE